MAVIEALASGTPVVAMRRGAMPVIITHGLNGFLADDEQEFRDCLRHVDEIDPAACRRSVEDHFSAARMAARYVDLYEQVIQRAAAANGRAVADPRSNGAGRYANLLNGDDQA